MRSSHLAASLLVALVLTPVAAAAQDPQPVVRKAALRSSLVEVFEHEQMVWNALKANDVAAFNDLVQGPFTYIDRNGIVAWKLEDSAELLKGCTLNDFTTDQAQTQQPSSGIVILSYQITLDQACDGEKVPSPLSVLSVWQRHGNSWKLIAHSETVAPAAAQ